MAWQASGAWKRSLPKDASGDDSSFPGLKPATPDATTKIEYEELQRNELLALEAIYGDDFVKHTDTHSAWKVTLTYSPSSSIFCPLVTFATALSARSKEDVIDKQCRRQNRHSRSGSKHPPTAILP
jgi:translation initiation factor 2-alpha kinase 4